MSRLYLAAIAVYIGIFTSSIGYGWSSSALILYYQENSPVTIDSDEGGWIASIFMAGCALGPIATLTFSHLVGRKTVMLFAVLPCIVGYLMIAFATKVWELYVARFLTGVSSGVTFAAAPMYIGEIAPAKIRGILLTMIMVISRVGIFYAYTLVPFVSIKTSSLISIFIAGVFLIYFMWLPESPYYLLRRSDYGAAAKALAKFRGQNGDEIIEELIIIETSVKNEIANCNHHPLKIIFQSTNFKLLSIGVMLGLFQQLSGSQAIMMYTQIMFDNMNLGLDGKYVAIILGGVQIISAVSCAVVVEHYGRRPLLLLSTIGCFISTSIVAIYFNLQWVNVDITGFEWLAVLACMFYVVFYSVGLAPLLITMMGELFPTDIKPIACAIVICLTNATGFAVGKSYQIVSDSVGSHVAFWMFGVFDICATIFVYFCVPETKGKTLQEIQREMHKDTK